jgi:hypothetical protein
VSLKSVCLQGSGFCCGFGFSGCVGVALKLMQMELNQLVAQDALSQSSKSFNDFSVNFDSQPSDLQFSKVLLTQGKEALKSWLNSTAVPLWFTSGNFCLELFLESTMRMMLQNDAMQMMNCKLPAIRIGISSFEASLTKFPVGYGISDH